MTPLETRKGQISLGFLVELNLGLEGALEMPSFMILTVADLEALLRSLNQPVPHHTQTHGGRISGWDPRCFNGQLRCCTSMLIRDTQVGKGAASTDCKNCFLFNISIICIYFVKSVVMQVKQILKNKGSKFYQS
jgi:hypothetical protein